MLIPSDVITRLDGEPENAYQALLILAAKPAVTRTMSDVARACGVSKPTVGRWRDTWNWTRRLAAYDAATTDPVTGPLARIAAAADRPADPDARDEIVQQIRAYRSQVIESADKIHAVAMRTLDQVMARLNGMTDQDVAKMSMRDLAALTNAALAAIKQAQECKGNFYGLTEFIAYLENVERESTENPQVSHRSEDAKD